MERTETIEKMKELFEADDPSKVRVEFKELREQYLNLQVVEQEKLLEQFLAEGGERKDFVPPEVEEDKSFKEISDAYREKLKQFQEKQKAERAENLKLKTELITKIRNIIESEENIGRAFTQFKEVHENWKEIGEVPRENTRDLQAEYSQVIESFYHNVKIYRELQANDLKKNLELREEVVTKVKKLDEEKSIRELELLLPAFITEWDNSGPVAKEEWEGIRTKFWEAVNAQNHRISEHYKEKREGHKENLAKKKELVQKVQEITQKLEGLEKVSQWEKFSAQVKEIQKEWKQTGYAGKKENDRVWKEFRAACDQFFQTKSGFFGDVKKEQKGIKKSKQDLIAEVESLKNSTDWKNTTKRILDIQKKWKSLGGAHPRDERKLWTDFRTACDHFFSAKKAHFDGFEGRKKENVGLKESKLKELASFEPNGEDSKEQVRKLLLEYFEIGPVDEKAREGLNDSFRKERGNVLKKIGIEGKEANSFLFEIRLDRLVMREAPEQELLREKRSLEDKLKRLNSDRLQYENNLGFFAHVKDDNPMKREVLDKVEHLDSLKKDQLEKISTLNRRLKSLKKDE